MSKIAGRLLEARVVAAFIVRDSARAAVVGERLMPRALLFLYPIPLFAERRYFRVPEAADDVVIHETNGLHPRVDGQAFQRALNLGHAAVGE
jgi:hypothetical protein